LAKHCISQGLFDKARVYAKSGMQLARRLSASYGLLSMTFAEAQFLSARAEGVDRVNDLLTQYRHALDTVEYHLGVDHPIAMTLYDKMVHLLCLAERTQKAHDFLQLSLTLASRVLGGTHSVTAGYMTKVN
jgi:hypothetical protein